MLIFTRGMVYTAYIPGGASNISSYVSYASPALARDDQIKPALLAELTSLIQTLRPGIAVGICMAPDFEPDI
jgi:hypothetical protein